MGLATDGDVEQIREEVERFKGEVRNNFVTATRFERALDDLVVRVERVVAAAMPLSAVMGPEGEETTVHWEALMGDALWHAVDGRQAVRLHQQGYRVRQHTRTRPVEIQPGEKPAAGFTVEQRKAIAEFAAEGKRVVLTPVQQAVGDAAEAQERGR